MEREVGIFDLSYFKKAGRILEIGEKNIAKILLFATNEDVIYDCQDRNLHFSSIYIGRKVVYDLLIELGFGISIDEVEIKKSRYGCPFVFKPENSSLNEKWLSGILVSLTNDEGVFVGVAVATKDVDDSRVLGVGIDLIFNKISKELFSTCPRDILLEMFTSRELEEIDGVSEEELDCLLSLKVSIKESIFKAISQSCLGLLDEINPEEISFMDIEVFGSDIKLKNGIFLLAKEVGIGALKFESFVGDNYVGAISLVKNKYTEGWIKI